MNKIDWEFIILFFGLPVLFFLFLAFMLYITKPDANLEHEKYKICIESGMQWKKGDCVEKPL